MQCRTVLLSSTTPEGLYTCLRSLKNDLFWARIGTVALCTIASIFATYSYYYNDRLVALLGAFGWGTFAAAIVPVLVIGLNWKKATREAAHSC